MMKLNALFESTSIDLLDFVYRSPDGFWGWQEKLTSQKAELRDNSGQYTSVGSIYINTAMAQADASILYNDPNERIGGQIVKVFEAVWHNTTGVFDQQNKTVEGVDIETLIYGCRDMIRESNGIGNSNRHLSDKSSEEQKSEMLERLLDDDKYQDLTEQYFDDMMQIVAGMDLPRFAMYGNKNVAAIRKIFESVWFKQKAVYLLGRNYNNAKSW